MRRGGTGARGGRGPGRGRPGRPAASAVRDSGPRGRAEPARLSARGHGVCIGYKGGIPAGAAAPEVGGAKRYAYGLRPSARLVARTAYRARPTDSGLRPALRPHGRRAGRRRGIPPTRQRANAQRATRARTPRAPRAEREVTSGEVSAKTGHVSCFLRRYGPSGSATHLS